MEHYMKYINVAINLPVKNLFKQFTYAVPPQLDHVDVGWRVVVPFGYQTVEGFVTSLAAAAPAEYECKEILATLDTRPCWQRQIGCPNIICVRRLRRCGCLFQVKPASSGRLFITMKVS